MTTKIPPSFDGKTTWFTFEDAIDDWCDIPELDEEKRAPALRNRLEGDATIYKNILDRDALKNKEEGMIYFKRTQVFFLPFSAVYELAPWFIRFDEVDVNTKCN